MNTNKKKTEFKKPNIFVYKLLAFFVRIYLWIKFKPEYKLDELKNIDGPAVILCSHTSNLDFLLLAVGLLPVRPTYIMSNHFFVHPKIGKLLAPLHAIPKKMFCADVNAIRQIMRASKSGNVIVMFPEGRLSCCGHTVGLADGTPELLKKLGVDVYWVVENGLYKALPKWGKAGIRKGPVSIEGGKLFEGSELKALSVSDIEARLADAIRHDDESVYVGETYKCDKPALGLEGILYKCPVCGKEFSMVSYAHTLKCKACGTVWELNEKYELSRRIESGARDNVHECNYNDARDGLDFNSINAWFDWEQDAIDLDKGLECDCILATPGEDGINDRNAGKGHISINREDIHFVGECFGQPLEFTEKTSFIKAFPATVGDHFDIYSNKIMYNIIPQPNPDESIKWVQFLDKLNSK
ncbi:MAG: 1-acyl-sn-glycerol-3-phosphate acyltransferase [Clostridiales bacterium]|nr:1-acyl-sn-glycerol-3-phosphate acyltransferase [Candidatus Crickella caballi]